MRVAQVAPLYESVPPRLYGGTERVVSWLTEELAAQGHHVTLFASGDSETSAPLPGANWAGTVPHGLSPDRHTFRDGEGRYLAFLGRISPEKRVDRVIEIAGRTGLPIRIAAKVDPADREYFEAEIKRLLTLPYVEFIGEVSEDEKSEFLGQARALIFPIDWKVLSRRRCRQEFERRFTAARMARDYLAIYQRLLSQPTAIHSPYRRVAKA